MPRISPHAIIDPSAEIADDVELGPFCVIGPDVKIDSGCRLLNNVTILGRTTIGKDNVFFPNSVIGAAPQDKKFKGENTELNIGNANVFREAVTVHVGTEKGGGITRIGDNGLYMVNAHIGHDAAIGNHVVLANNAFILGQEICHDHVAIMAAAGICHFVTLSHCSYVGAFSQIHYDVPPFLKVDGPDQIRGVNKIGMNRAGYQESDVRAIESAHHLLFTRGYSVELATAHLERENVDANHCVKRLLEYVRRRRESPPQ